MQPLNILYIVFILLAIPYQKKSSKQQPPFELTPTSVRINNTLTEASGIAGSRTNPGHLWVQEDGGHPAQLLLLKTDGSLVKSITVTGATNNDWEDLALSKGPDPALDYIFIADIGDNLKAQREYTIYRFPEPAANTNATIASEKIRFQYPDGPHDAEAIFVEGASKDIYVITKSDNPAQVFKLSYPQSITALNQAVKVATLGYGSVTGAAISPDGREIIVKTYLALNYYPVTAGQKVGDALKKTPVTLAYQLEPQGEAVAFAVNNDGFYTLSEKAFSSVVNLYFYKRR